MRQGRVGIVGWSEERESVCEVVETAESVPKRSEALTGKSNSHDANLEAESGTKLGIFRLPLR
jgi:hypothetical protein